MTTWFCPRCGRSMTVRREADNMTGRMGVTIGCPTAGHYRSPRRDTVEQADRELERMFRP